jgi:HK97 family phage major capsid protein
MMKDDLFVDWLQSVIQSRVAFDDNTRAAHSRALQRIGSPAYNKADDIVDYSLPDDLTRSVLPMPEYTRTGTTYSGQQYGMSIKPGFADEITDRARPITVPSGLVEWVPTQSLEWIMPTVSETNSDTGRYGGFTPFYGGEENSLGNLQDSKLSQVTWTNTRLIIYTTLSRDLWEDAPRLRVWFDKIASGAIQYYLNKAIVLGITGCPTGPQGIPNAPGTVTVAKQSGQSSGTIVSLNIDGMWSALYAGSKQAAVWLCADDTLQAIDQLSTAVAATASPETPYIGYVAAGRYGVPYPTLKGRPIIPCEYCPVIGTPGDLILWDPTDWILTYRSSQQAASIGAISVSVDVPPGKHWSGAYGLPNDAVERRMSGHVPTLFQQDTLAIYWKMRLDCRSLWTSTAVNRNGATVGNAVVLAQR